MNPDDFNVTTHPGEVWRVGWAPNPWAWSDWACADDDRRFNGRWDDQLGQFRTIYTAETLLGCFLEVLAQLRPDMLIEDELDAIVDDDGTGALFPTADAGVVGFDWLEDRMWAHGTQTGTYCYVTHSESVETLAKTGVFTQFGIPTADIGTDILKNPHTRRLTRTIARRITTSKATEPRPSRALSSALGTATTSACGRSSSEALTVTCPSTSSLAPQDRSTQRTTTSSPRSSSSGSAGQRKRDG